MIRRMAAPFRGTVELDDGTIWEERDYLSVAGGTIDQIGLNFRPFHRYARAAGHVPHPRHPHVADGLRRAAPADLARAPMRPGHTFEADHDQRRRSARPKSPIRYMVDGDLHECDGPLHVSIGPRVRIVVGT